MDSVYFLVFKYECKLRQCENDLETSWIKTGKETERNVPSHEKSCSSNSLSSSFSNSAALSSSMLSGFIKKHPFPRIAAI